MPPSIKTVLTTTHGLEGKYIPEFQDLESQVKLLKGCGFRVALTQGVYDMFHVGHARYLADARACGDVLIVGVDSDELTRQMKGEGRPFDSFEERIELLSHLSAVNIITRRHTNQHMYDLIKLVRPDVLVLSETTSTVKPEDLAAFTEYAGEVKHLERRAATSTTAKLRKLKVDGAKGLADHLALAAQAYLAGDGVER